MQKDNSHINYDKIEQSEEFQRYKKEKIYFCNYDSRFVFILLLSIYYDVCLHETINDEASFW